MRYQILIILANLVFIQLGIGQNQNKGDFLELGIRTSQLTKSTFLENSIYKSELSDPLIENIGFLASPTGRGYAAKLRYGKKIFTKTHLMAELGYVSRNEQVVCFCHDCDKISKPNNLIKVNAFDMGLGLRFEIIRINKIRFFLEGIGNYSVSTNEVNISYFGYAIHPLIEYPLNEKLHANLRYGWEQSFGGYEKKERYIEIAIKYKMQKSN